MSERVGEGTLDEQFGGLAEWSIGGENPVEGGQAIKEAPYFHVPVISSLRTP